MQRPVMDPMMSALDGDDAGEEESFLPRRGASHRIRKLLAGTFRVSRNVARVLFSKPFQIRQRDSQPAERPAATRFFRALGYRLLFVPIFLALAAAALVYRGTHPIRIASDKLPEVPGMFYETMDFAGADGQPLMAWFVPVVDAKRVLELKSKVYKGKQPAVVLVHDFNQSPSQMVPLVGPLHDQGFIVLAVGLRGIGRDGRVAAQTFGINESADVRAALTELRKRTSVDGEHIAIVGVGSGANAAVITASQEPGIVALVLINAFGTTQQAIAERVGPGRHGMCWMQLASKWAFEVAYHVDADDLNLCRYRDVLANRPTISFQRERGEEFDEETVSLVRDFCKDHLPKDSTSQFANAASSGR